MIPEDHEALMERLDGIFEDLQQGRQAIEWLQDHSPDEHLSSNLGMIRTHLARTEIKIHILLGRPGYKTEIFEDVPFD